MFLVNATVFNFESFSRYSLEKNSNNLIMMSMVDKNLTTEMFEFNSLSQFSIALFIYHDGWGCHYAKARAFKAKAKDYHPWLTV